MLETPTILNTDPQQAAVIHLTVPWEEIQNIMEPGLAELMAAVSARGIGPVGPWFNHHLHVQPDVVDVEICVPVSTPVAPVGRVERREARAANGWIMDSYVMHRAARHEDDG